MIFNRTADWHWSRKVIFGAAVATCISLCMVAAFAATLLYVAPATNELRSGSPNLKPIVEHHWIKMPFDIYRTKECLANSTLTLRRDHDYGDGLGPRTDIVTLGLYNTTITGLGRTPVMLWFRQPDDLDPGEWFYDSKTQDDCGGIGDLLNFAIRNPRSTQIPHVLVIPEPET